MMDAIAELLHDIDIKYIRIDGKTTIKERSVSSNMYYTLFFETYLFLIQGAFK